MTTLLLDADVVIALTVADHEHHERASRWFVTVEQAAVCPVVEGALIRFLVRVGVSATSARALLAALHTDPRMQLWPDALSYADLDVGHIVGHRQVPDAYLAGVALSRGGRLATLDTALSEALPHAVLLIPQQR